MSNAILPEIQKKILLGKIIDWICDDGFNRAEVKKLIIENAPSPITEEGAYELIQEAFNTLAEIHNAQNDPVEIFNQHIQWYEHIYAYFQSIDHAAGMNKSMQAKERLLNILKEKNKMVYRKSETIIHSNGFSRNEKYNTDKLTTAKKDRLNYLIQKGTLYEGE
jgi:hypothetical protein